jgi:predicted MFS family arabinose efflux permease
VLIEAAQQRPMLELSLFRVPTFTGGLLAAFGISASLFSLLTYIILYLQADLGFSPLGTGLRVLFLTVPVFVAVGIAGRLTAVVPVRPMTALGAIFAGQLLSTVTRRLAARRCPPTPTRSPPPPAATPTLTAAS